MKVILAVVLLSLAAGCFVKVPDKTQSSSPSTPSPISTSSSFSPSSTSQPESPEPSSSPSPTSSSAPPPSTPPPCTGCVTISSVYLESQDHCQNVNGYNGWKVNTDQGRKELQIKDSWTGQFKQFASSRAQLQIQTEKGSNDYPCDFITSYQQV